jgi:hypothetical protein
MLRIKAKKSEAHEQLAKIRKQKTCTMFVFNEELAELAQTRVAHDLRQVAFVEKRSVLEDAPDYEDLNAALTDGVVIITMTVEFRVSSTLKGKPDEVDVEDAFAEAAANP